MTTAALVVSILAIIVSVGSAAYAARVTRHVGGSGFKAEEQLKADLVTLLAALRGIIVKGVLAGQDNTFRSIDKELDVIRTFQASTSGMALSTWAAEQGHKGASQDAAAGRWRTLSINLGNLAGAELSHVAQENAKLLEVATDIELTLEDLGSQDIRDISRRTGDLPATFAALKETRSKDILLRAWFEVHEERHKQLDPQIVTRRLEALKSAGHQDPDIDLLIAVIAGDIDGVAKAHEQGANLSVTVDEIFERYERAAASETT